MIYNTLLKKNNGLEQPDHTWLSRPQWGAARFDENTRLMLHFLKSNQALIINMHQLEQAIVGRYDPASDLTPDVDLTILEAVEAGVSRCHIQLEVLDNMLRITDLGSMNGTSINGKLLKPYTSILLRDGDELQLGLLKCMVFFKKES